MTIKTKLIFGYAVILAFVLAIAGSSYWAIRRWGGAAEELSSTYNSVLTAERLRANMTRQINFGRDFIYGDLAGAEEFREARNLSSDILNELKKNALNEDEMDHIKGLEVTHYELAWVIEGLLAKSPQLSSRPDAISARGRLREISDEVSDDIAALVQYYRAQEARSIGGAHRAGKIATAVIGSAGALAALLLVGLAFLLQRWLVYPIAVMNDTMRAISAGDLDAQAPIKSNDEWGHLASAVNKMSKALKASQQNLILQERLAALGEIASYTAHNLRNPLAGIRAATQVALCERRNR